MKNLESIEVDDSKAESLLLHEELESVDSFDVAVAQRNSERCCYNEQDKLSELADEIAEDLVIDCLADVTQQLINDMKHKQLLEENSEKQTDSLEVFGHSRKSYDSQIRRVHSNIETDRVLRSGRT